MTSGTPVESMAAAIYTALADPNVLPDIEIQYGRRSAEKQKGRPSLYDIDVIQFPQTWGSTALGFGGMGGAAMTKAYTTVIICRENAAVFFAGRHCYSVDGINDAFKEDLKNKHMRSLKEADGRY
jgi:hypothetical protein